MAAMGSAAPIGPVVLAWAVTTALMVFLHHGLRRLVRWGWCHASGGEVWFLGLCGGGLWGFGAWVDCLHRSGTLGRPLPVSFRVAALLLYLTGCLVYGELLSLCSRGYSLRILVDLLSRGGSANVEDLKAGYGGGIGIRGLLVRRLDSLARLRLLAFDGHRVGPLTAPGQLFAAIGASFRKALRLEQGG